MEIWNRAREFLGGTPDEVAAVDRLGELEGKTTLSKRDKADLPTLKHLQRRLMLKRIVFVGGVAATGGLGWLAHELTQPRSSSPVLPEIPTALPVVPTAPASLEFDLTKLYEEGEKVAQIYIAGYKEVAKFDPKGEENLRLLETKRRRGALIPDVKGAHTVTDATDFNPNENFTSAVLKPGYERIFPGLNSAFAATDMTWEIGALLLWDRPVSKLWAGVTLAHEMVHIGQYLWHRQPHMYSLPFPSPRELRAENELEAYTTQFQVMDNYTNGKFFSLLAEVTAGNKGVYIGQDKMDFSRFNSVGDLFGMPLHETEVGSRRASFLYAANFRVVDMNTTTPELAKKNKMLYLMSVGAA